MGTNKGRRNNRPSPMAGQDIAHKNNGAAHVCRHGSETEANSDNGFTALADIVFEDIYAVNVRLHHSISPIYEELYNNLGAIYNQLYQAYNNYFGLLNIVAPELKGNTKGHKIQEMRKHLHALFRKKQPLLEVRIVWEEEGNTAAFIVLDEYYIEPYTIFCLPMEYFAMLRDSPNPLYRFSLPLLNFLKIEVGVTDNKTGQMFDYIFEYLINGDVMEENESYDTQETISIYANGGEMERIVNDIMKAEDYVSVIADIYAYDPQNKAEIWLKNWLLEGYNLITDSSSQHLAQIQYGEGLSGDYDPIRLEDIFVFAWSNNDTLMKEYEEHLTNIFGEAGGFKPCDIFYISCETKLPYKQNTWFNRFYKWYASGTNYLYTYCNKNRKKCKTLQTA